MVATPARTPNLNLPRLDASSGTDLWNHFNALADGVDARFGTWQSYTPTWSQSDGTQLNIGVGGTIQGRYVQLGKVVHVSIFLQRGEGSNQGTTWWVWSLPPISPRRYQAVGGGFAMFRDGGYHGGAVYPVSGTAVGAIVGGGGRVSNTVPTATHALDDWYSLQITYEAA